MDARKLRVKIINEAIKNRNYRITGITDNGEIVISILSNMEKESISRCFSEKKSQEEKLNLIKSMQNISGRSANELMQIYLQETAKKEDCCIGNGLRIK